MVAIKKGSKRLRVPNSAYENFYKGFGWKLDDDVEIKKTVTNVEETVEELNHAEDDDEDWDSVVEEDEDIEKPLSEMSHNELKKKASSLGINTAGLNSKQLREKIKSHSL